MKKYSFSRMKFFNAVWRHKILRFVSCIATERYGNEMKKMTSLILAIVMIALMIPVSAMVTGAVGEDTNDYSVYSESGENLYTVDFKNIKSNDDLASAGWLSIAGANGPTDNIAYVDGGVRYGFSHLHNFMLSSVKFSKDKSYIVEYDFKWDSTAHIVQMHFGHSDTTTFNDPNNRSISMSDSVVMFRGNTDGTQRYGFDNCTYYADADFTNPIIYSDSNGLSVQNCPFPEDIAAADAGKTVTMRMIIATGTIKWVEMVIDGGTIYYLKPNSARTVSDGNMFGFTHSGSSNSTRGIILESFKVDLIDAPQAAVPTGVVYQRDDVANGMADGTVIINLSADHNAERINLYWGDDSGKLADHSMIGSIEVSAADTEIIYNMSSGTIIPPGATKLMAYSCDEWSGENPQFSETAVSAYQLPLEGPLLGFHAVSDTHYGRNTSWEERIVAMLNDVASNGAYSEGLFVVGDAIQGSNTAENVASDGAVEKEQYAGFAALCNSVSGIPNVYPAMGNHEFFAWYPSASVKGEQGAIDAFVNNINANYSYIGLEDGWNKPYYDVEINGYQFIILGGTEQTNATECKLDQEQLDWLDGKLAAADENEPVFIMLHYPIAYTVAYEEATGNDISDLLDGEDLRAVLDKYSNVVMFNGHTHYAFENTAVKHIFRGDGGNVTFNTSSVGEHAEGYYVEVYNDRIIVRGRNFYTGEWISSAQFAFDTENNSSGITDVSISLSEDVVVKFHTGVNAFDGYKLRVGFNDITYEITNSENGVFSFTKVTPQYFHKEMTVALFDKNGTQVGQSKTVSVKTYLESLLALNYENSECGSELQFAAMRELAVNLLNYGAAAQACVNQDVEDLANKDLTAEQRALATDTIAVAESDEEVCGDAWVGVGVRYDYRLGLYFVFQANSLDGVTATINDKAVTPEAYNVSGYENCWIIRFNDFTAVNMNDVVTAKLTGIGSEEQTFSYSIKSYVATKGSENNALAELVNATYAYGFAAVAYSTNRLEIAPTFEESGYYVADNKGYDFSQTQYASYFQEREFPVLNLTDYTVATVNKGTETEPEMITTYTHKATGAAFTFAADSYINVNGTKYSPFDINKLNKDGVEVSYDETEGYTYHAETEQTLTHIGSVGKPLTVTGKVKINTSNQIPCYNNLTIGKKGVETKVVLNSTYADGYSLVFNNTYDLTVAEDAYFEISGSTKEIRIVSNTSSNYGRLVVQGTMKVPAINIGNYSSIVVSGSLTTTSGGIKMTSGGEGITVNAGAELKTAGDIQIERNNQFTVDGVLKVGGGIKFGTANKNGKALTIGSTGTAIVVGDVAIGTTHTLVVNGTLAMGGTLNGNVTTYTGSGTVTQNATVNTENWTWEAKS